MTVVGYRKMFRIFQWFSGLSLEYGITITEVFQLDLQLRIECFFGNLPKSRRELLNALNAASSFEYFWNNSFFIESFSFPSSKFIQMFRTIMIVYEPVPDDEDRKSAA